MKYGISVSEIEQTLKGIDRDEVCLFAMSGQMGSGKDTVGNAIAKKLEFYGYKIKQTSFATELRKEIDEIVSEVRTGEPLGLIAAKWNVRLSELRTLLYYLGKSSIYDRTPEARKAIQYWGTDVRRKQDENYWVNKVVEFTLKQHKLGNSVYVSDVRFPNEAQAIDDLSGLIVRLDVPTEVRVDRIMYRDGNPPTSVQLNHASETALDDYEFKFTVDGCKTPEEISEQIVRVIRLTRD